MNRNREVLVMLERHAEECSFSPVSKGRNMNKEGTFVCCDKEGGSSLRRKEK
jgi:hypothetical protein